MGQLLGAFKEWFISGIKVLIKAYLTTLESASLNAILRVAHFIIILNTFIKNYDGYFQKSKLNQKTIADSLRYENIVFDAMLIIPTGNRN